MNVKWKNYVLGHGVIKSLSCLVVVVSTKLSILLNYCIYVSNILYFNIHNHTSSKRQSQTTICFFFFFPSADLWMRQVGWNKHGSHHHLLCHAVAEAEGQFPMSRKLHLHVVMGKHAREREIESTSPRLLEAKPPRIEPLKKRRDCIIFWV